MSNFILRDENAIYYECGYSCDNSIYLKLGSDGFFFTDSRYEIEANNLIANDKIVITNTLAKSASEIIKHSVAKNIKFDPHEWSVADFNILTTQNNTTFEPVNKFSQIKRAIKNDLELNKLQQAAILGAEAFDSFATFLSTNASGLDEYYLTYKAKNILSNKGKYNLSFDPIVAINANVAKPHATPTDTMLKQYDLLLFDAGLKFDRYCSDRTRTISFNGDVTSNYNQKFDTLEKQKVYDLVLKAHDEAILNAKTGMRASEIDAVARDVIEAGGYGDYFIHSTGHGVGLDIHELPVISSKSNTIIEDGMVFTIEPGIYLADLFGVRIEDTVEMKNGRACVL